MIAFREVAEKDLIRLAEYLPAQPPFLHTTREIWESRFDIWWASNPAFTDQVPRGWVLENETSFLGFIGNVPVKFLICGEEKTAVAAVSWYVDPSVRGLSGIRLFNAFLKQKSASLFLFNTDNKDIIKVLKRNKFKEFILPRSQTKYFFIFNKKKIGFILIEMGLMRRFRDFTSFWTILKQLGSFTSQLLHQKPRVRQSSDPSGEYITTLCTSCDDSFSKIWETTLSNCSVTLSHDIKTLNWIYFSSISQSQRIVIQCRRTLDNSLAGYMVFDLRQKNLSGSAVMKLMDMCVERNDPRVIYSILQYVSEIVKKNNVPLLELWALDAGTETYLKNNFVVCLAAQHHNFIRLSDFLEPQSESLTICPSLIAPPRGIDHF